MRQNLHLDENSFIFLIDLCMQISFLFYLFLFFSLYLTPYFIQSLFVYMSRLCIFHIRSILNILQIIVQHVINQQKKASDYFFPYILRAYLFCAYKHLTMLDCMFLCWVKLKFCEEGKIKRAVQIFLQVDALLLKSWLFKKICLTILIIFLEGCRC